MKRNYTNVMVLGMLVICLSLFLLPLQAKVVPSPAISSIAYDGLFFLGFNLRNDLFKGDKGLKVRQAISMAVERKKIANDLAKDPKVPSGIIPYGMEGYLDSQAPTVDLQEAKQIMVSAGYKMADKRLKTVRLLHTNGILTQEIAKELKENLKHLGIKIILEGIDYSDGEKWEAALKKGNYQLFLLGVKADDPEKIETFLTPIFHSKKGDANFMNYKDNRVDQILVNLVMLKNEPQRVAQLKELQQKVNSQLPIISLFNIERIQ